MGEVKFSYKISCNFTTSLSVRLDNAYFAENWKKKIKILFTKKLLVICLIALFWDINSAAGVGIKKKKKKKAQNVDADALPKQTLNIFLLKVNIDKFTIELHNFFILSILAKFIEDQRLRWYSNPPTPLALRKSSGWYLWTWLSLSTKFAF